LAWPFARRTSEQLAREPHAQTGGREFAGSAWDVPGLVTAQFETGKAKEEREEICQ